MQTALAIRVQLALCDLGLSLRLLDRHQALPTPTFTAFLFKLRFILPLISLSLSSCYVIENTITVYFTYNAFFIIHITGYTK
jgi:hypothetical protein